MSMSRTKRMGALAAGLSCLLAGYALAQQDLPGQPDRPRQPRPGDTQRNSATSPEVDRYLASCWQANNQAEIEISKIAQQKAQNPQVKEFAQTMVQAHGQLSQKLQPLASGQGDEGRSPGSASGVQAIEQLIAIDKQIVENTTEMMRQKLDEKSGADFDKCYVGGQIACHIHASAALGVVSQQASGQLKQLASQAKQTVDQHLQEAEQLAKQLDQQSDGRPDGRQQTRAIRDRDLRPAGAQQQ